MRYIALIDMDCFYAQVEQRDKPSLWGKPVAVVQYAREGAYGGIIALSYEAKWAGVKRGMFIPEAKVICPNLEIAYVPQGEHADKADIQKYRDASAEVFNVLNNVDPRIIVEKASVDEAFLDITQYCQEVYEEIENKEEYLDDLIKEIGSRFATTHIADGRDINSQKIENYIYDREANVMEWLNIACRGDSIEYKLAIAAATVEKIRADVNKVLAKLVCARHKPRQQSVVALTSVSVIFEHTPIEDVRNLGGKLGKALKQTFNINLMSELAALKYDKLVEKFPNQCGWLWNLARGVDDEPVKPRNTVGSIAVSKNFPGKNVLNSVVEVTRWVDGLSKELSKRLVADRIKFKRSAENLVIIVCNPSVHTKTLKISSYNPQFLFNLAWSYVRMFNKAPVSSASWEPPIFHLGLSASKFSEGVTGESKSILQWVKEAIPLKKSEETPEKEDEKPSTSTVVTIDDEQLDDEGWQIYDPRLFDKEISEPELIQFGGLEIAKDVYDELPEIIKSELENERRLNEAKKRLEEEQKARIISAAQKPSNLKSKRKKRTASHTVDQPPPKNTIDKFFARL